MKEFIEKYADRIHGVFSCFDRMLFRRYLPIMSGWQMAQFFNGSGIRFRELKTFLECLGLPSRAPPLARAVSDFNCRLDRSTAFRRLAGSPRFLLRSAFLPSVRWTNA